MFLRTAAITVLINNVGLSSLQHMLAMLSAAESTPCSGSVAVAADS
jgi:hypothetical protein